MGAEGGRGASRGGILHLKFFSQKLSEGLDFRLSRPYIIP
jgi:hypothetical protein